MKTLIVILVLFSSSLLAEDNLPAPFGIQLGEPVSDDLMCESIYWGDEVVKWEDTTLEPNISYLDYMKSKNPYDPNCNIEPPKKNERYDVYEVYTTKDKNIVYKVRGVKRYSKGESDKKFIKEYFANLNNFLVAKYNLERVFDPMHCYIFENIEKNKWDLENLFLNSYTDSQIERVETTLKNMENSFSKKFTEYCNQYYEINPQRDMVTVDFSDLKDLDLSESEIELIKAERLISAYEKLKIMEIEYKKRTTSLDECFQIEESFRKSHSMFFEKERTLESYTEDCYFDILLENSDIKITFVFWDFGETSSNNQHNIQYLLKRHVHDYIDTNHLIKQRDLYKAKVQKEKEERSKETSVDDDSL